MTIRMLVLVGVVVAGCGHDAPVTQETAQTVCERDPAQCKWFTVQEPHISCADGWQCWTNLDD